MSAACPAPFTGPDEPVPFTLTAKAYDYLDRAALSVQAAAAAVIVAALKLEAAIGGPALPGPDEWWCDRCGDAYWGDPPDDGVCRRCRDDERHAPVEECARCGSLFSTATGWRPCPACVSDFL